MEFDETRKTRHSPQSQTTIKRKKTGSNTGESETDVIAEIDEAVKAAEDTQLHLKEVDIMEVIKAARVEKVQVIRTGVCGC